MRLRYPALLIAAGATIVLTAGAASAATSHTAAPGFSKNGTYSFASDTYDYSASGTFRVTPYAQTHSDSSQSLAADGVELTTDPGSSGYADSGVIVDLGDLDSLFPGGTYTAPVIGGSANLGVNFYLDTNGTDTFGSINASDVWTGADGNNYASMGPASGALDSADFGTFSSEPGTDTAFSALGSKTLTMSQVEAAYQNTFGHYGVKTADPQVFAWIGISGSAAQAGYVTSVDGTDLVTSPSADAVTVTYACGTGQGHYTWRVSLSGSYEAKVNEVSRVTVRRSSRWAWDGSFWIHPGKSDTVTTHKGYRLGIYYTANGSQPAPHEAGALFAEAAAPGVSSRKACG